MWHTGWAESRYTVYYTLYPYFWPTLYLNVFYCMNCMIQLAHGSSTVCTSAYISSSSTTHHEEFRRTPVLWMCIWHIPVGFEGVPSCTNYYVLLTAIGLSPGGNCTIHIYTHTINRMTQNKRYTEQQWIWEYKNFGIVRAVPRLGELYHGIRLTTEEKARKNLSQGR